MTKEELAARLNGREYGEEITEDEALAARASGLVVVFGYSDDSMEFEGAIDEEIPCCDGGEILIVDGKIVGSGKGSCGAGDGDCKCQHRGKMIEAVWCAPDSPDWTYVTEIPHATFDVMDDGDVYCRGIVFALADVARV